MKKQSLNKVLTIVSIFFVAFGCFFTNIKILHAAESSGTSVTFTVKENETYLLSVSVEGKGSIFDGKEVIRDQINKYHLENGTYKTFRIVPDEGYEISRVTLNGKDITNLIINGEITVKSEDYEQVLVFYFTKTTDSDNEKPGGVNKKPDNSQTNSHPNRVETGDATRKMLYGLTLVASISVLVIVVKRKKDKEEE